MNFTEDLKEIIASNIIALRTEKGYTQIELAEKLNYSDKAVSKWERGKSVPDIEGLKSIADLFGVSVDYLISPLHPTEEKREINNNSRTRRNHSLITGMSIMLVWLISLFVYVNMNLASVRFGWLTFVLAVPASCIVWLVFNSVWFNRKTNFFIISLLMWSVVASVYILFLIFGKNFWIFFSLCLPGQAIIIMWSGIKGKLKNTTKERQ